MQVHLCPPAQKLTLRLDLIGGQGPSTLLETLNHKHCVGTQTHHGEKGLHLSTRWMEAVNSRSSKERHVMMMKSGEEVSRYPRQPLLNFILIHLLEPHDLT